MSLPIWKSQLSAASNNVPGIHQLQVSQNLTRQPKVAVHQKDLTSVAEKLIFLTMQSAIIHTFASSHRSLIININIVRG